MVHLITDATHDLFKYHFSTLLSLVYPLDRKEFFDPQAFQLSTFNCDSSFTLVLRVHYLTFGGVEGEAERESKSFALVDHEKGTH